MGEIHRPSALRFLQQDVDELLPHAGRWYSRKRQWQVCGEAAMSWGRSSP